MTPSATVRGSTASCAFQISFASTVGNPQDGVALSCEVDAVSGSGAAVRANGQGEIGVAYRRPRGESALSCSVTM
ncbi:MAG: hypothetical protein WBM14_13865 [Terracidiphilus sp.]